MKMEMTTEEKDLFLARIINEYFKTQKTNPLYIPFEHLQAKGLDLSDIQNALWRLKDNNTVKEYRHCWGFFEIKNKKKEFVITGEIIHTDDDVEVYEVKVVAEKLTELTKNTSTETGNKRVTLHLNKDGDLYKTPKEKFCYEMQGKGVPLKILNYFIGNPNQDYEEGTLTIARNLSISDKQLRTEIGKMKKKVKSIFGFAENVELIESRQGSGYRLNPSIEIIKED